MFFINSRLIRPLNEKSAKIKISGKHNWFNARKWSCGKVMFLHVSVCWLGESWGMMSFSVWSRVPSRGSGPMFLLGGSGPWGVWLQGGFDPRREDGKTLPHPTEPHKWAVHILLERFLVLTVLRETTLSLFSYNIYYTRVFLNEFCRIYIISRTWKIFLQKCVFEPATSWVRDQDSTTAPARHR